MNYFRKFVNLTAAASLLLFSLLVLDTVQAQSDPLVATYNWTVQLFQSGKHKKALPLALELQKLAKKIGSRSRKLCRGAEFGGVNS